MKKTFIIITVIFALLILIVAVLYVNLRNFTVKKIAMDDSQEIYLMGTFHTEHFKRYANYSMEEMIAAIDHIEPDAVFIEARESSYIEYGMVDGPVDMCVAYCYCMDNGIPVEMIDYWKIDNDFKGNTTTDERNDRIHENIMEKRVLFYGHTVPRLVQADDTLNEDTKAKWAEDENNVFYNSQMKYCELFQNHKLYPD